MRPYGAQPYDYQNPRVKTRGYLQIPLQGKGLEEFLQLSLSGLPAAWAKANRIFNAKTICHEFLRTYYFCIRCEARSFFGAA